MAGEKKPDRKQIQSDVIDIVSDVIDHSNRALRELTQMGFEVPQDLGNDVYEMTASHLEYQTKLWKKVHDSAASQLDAYWKRRGGRQARSEFQVLKQGESHFLILVVENGTQAEVKVAGRKGTPAPGGSATLTQVELASEKLAPGDTMNLVWRLALASDAAVDKALRVHLEAKVGTVTFSQQFDIVVEPGA